MEFIILKASSINLAIGEDHLAGEALVSTPDSLEDGAVAPGHLAVAIAATCLEVPLVLCLFEVRSSISRQKLAVLDLTMPVRSSIFEHTAEHVTVFVVYLR